MISFLNNIEQLLNLNYIIFLFVLSFLIGAIPFGLIITNIAGYGDIRNIGSGNIGATNVLRTGNKKLAFYTLILDLSKSLLLLLLIKTSLTQTLSNDLLITVYIISALLSLLGHMYSPFLKLRGGKGIATSAGILLFISYPTAILSATIWILIAIPTKKSSLSALISSLSSIIFLWSIKQMVNSEILSSNFLITNKEFYLFIIIIILIWIKHIPNIKRIINKTESEIK
tara:strand:+ start:10009 stop:10692 length:684 start_codon:yes stop_codon:yes gene_type:complete